MDRTGDPSNPTRWVHRIPRAPLVDRAEFLIDRARAKSVVHLGFADVGLTEAKRGGGTWLHAQLAEVATDAAGIDLDEDAVTRARALGYAAHVADCQRPGALAALGLAPAEVVVAGELIEHLDLPGAFLDEVGSLVSDGGSLVITTPNAQRLTNVVGALLGRDIVSGEHVGWHSWKTLDTLLRRHGWRLEELAYYANPSASGGGALGAAARVFRVLARPLLSLRPALADGLVAVARRSPAD